MTWDRQEAEITKAAHEAMFEIDAAMTAARDALLADGNTDTIPAIVAARKEAREALEPRLRLALDAIESREAFMAAQEAMEVEECALARGYRVYAKEVALVAYHEVRRPFLDLLASNEELTSTTNQSN